MVLVKEVWRNFSMLYLFSYGIQGFLINLNFVSSNRMKKKKFFLSSFRFVWHEFYKCWKFLWKIWRYLIHCPLELSYLIYERISVSAETLGSTRTECICVCGTIRNNKKLRTFIQSSLGYGMNLFHMRLSHSRKWRYIFPLTIYALHVGFLTRVDVPIQYNMCQNQADWSETTQDGASVK